MKDLERDLIQNNISTGDFHSNPFQSILPLSLLESPTQHILYSLTLRGRREKFD